MEGEPARIRIIRYLGPQLRHTPVEIDGTLLPNGNFVFTALSRGATEEIIEDAMGQGVIVPRTPTDHVPMDDSHLA